MKSNLSTLLNGLDMYTDRGVFVGDVEDVVLDVEGERIHGIALGRINPDFAEVDDKVIVPFRWVRAIGDVVIVKHLPDKFRRVAPGEEDESDEEEQD